MKLWVDDVRPAPEGYEWLRSVGDAVIAICYVEKKGIPIDIIDLDHDAGDYYPYGGDYIKLLEWFEQTGRNYPIRIHSMNPVGRDNMRAIIRKNGWVEVR